MNYQNSLIDPFLRILRSLRTILLLESFSNSIHESDIISQQRFKLFRVTTLFALIVFIGTTYQIITAKSNDVWRIMVVLLMFVGIFINYFFLSVHKNTARAYAVLLVVGYLTMHILSYSQGGVRNSGTFFILTLILVAFVFFGKRGGQVMAIIGLLHMSYFYFINRYSNWVDYSLIGYDPALIDLDFLMTGTVSILLLAGQADYIEKGNNAVVRDIKTKRDELAAKNSQLLEIKTDLTTKNNELMRKNEELEQFAYVASHDLQEPLRTINDFVELVQNKYKGKLDEKGDQYLTFIAEASTRMQTLITDLLEFSSIGSDKVLSPVDCNKIVSEVLADLGAAIRESGASIEADVLPVIMGYPMEMKSLFQNLVMNALKFRRKDITPRITIRAVLIGREWLFSIEDNGIGIAKEHYERIFVIFQRLHVRNMYVGSGIGLAHCKKIVELHQGRIWLDSEPGKGTIFYFTIPSKQ